MDRPTIGVSQRRLATSLRLLTPTLVAGAVASGALAAPQARQLSSSQTVERAPAAAKYAGVFHATTNSWTRPGTIASASLADVVYSNTASAEYFSNAGGAGGFAPGAINFDEGGLPGTANGNSFAVGPDRDSYNINGFRIGYCDLGAPASGGWTIQFFEQYTPCTNATNPTATIVVSGLPANGCWIMDVDLSGGQEFVMAADGGDGWQDDRDFDSFGWSYQYSGTDGTGSAGFYLAADPRNTDPNYTQGGTPLDGSNTYFGTPSVCGGGGSGYLAQDLWWLEDVNDGGFNTGCYFFGGYRNNNAQCATDPQNNFAQWWMEIVADADGPGSLIGAVYCSTNPNSTGVATSIELRGSDAAADDTVCMTAGNVPTGSLGVFLTSQTQGFTANPGGSGGNLCLDGNIGRFLGQGQVRAADASGEISLDTTLGEWTLSAIPTSLPPLDYAASAGVTTNFQLWHRDAGPSGPSSNFSDGVSVTWN